MSSPGAPGRPRLSLRGRALACLSRRDYSRQELRRKLLEPPRQKGSAPGRRRAVDQAGDEHDPATTRAVEEAVAQALQEDGPVADPATGAAAVVAQAPPAAPTEAEVDEVLDWLEGRGYLSDARFVESRLNARAARHGSLRIRHELSRHGVEMTPEQSARLRETELDRAREVWRRKFGTVATEPKERARQARFLAARGFPADGVRRRLGGADAQA